MHILQIFTNYSLSTWHMILNEKGKYHLSRSLLYFSSAIKKVINMLHKQMKRAGKGEKQMQTINESIKFSGEC